MLYHRMTRQASWFFLGLVAAIALGFSFTL
jgi:hypothetical protein